MFHRAYFNSVIYKYQHMRWTVQRIEPQGSPRTPTTRIAATTPGLIIRILNSVFFKFLNIFKLFSNFNEVQTYSLMMIC